MARDQLAHLYRVSSDVCKLLHEEFPGTSAGAKTGPKEALMVLFLAVGRVAWVGMVRRKGVPVFTDALECYRSLTEGESLFSFFALGFEQEEESERLAKN